MEIGFYDKNQASAPLAPPPYQQTEAPRPQPPPPPPPTNDDCEQNYRRIVDTYEISREYADKLQQLRGFKVVFVFDDSGSMNSTLDDSPLNTPGSLLKATRWDELQSFAKIAIDIVTIFEQSGSDVYFLNRPMASNIVNISQIDQIFRDNKPSGYTPLPRILNQVFQQNANVVRERKLLIIIVTDGEPTDDTGKVTIKQFKSCLKNRQPIDRIFINIVACTDDDNSMDYLNKWDRTIKNLDVIDDFRNERLEIKNIKGNNFQFSYGDYVVKSLIGSVDPTIDKFDESRSKCSII
jgi:hypothetical protein